MRTGRALAIIFGTAFLSGVLAYIALWGLGSVRPRIRGDWPLWVFSLIALVLPIAIVILVWGKTRELQLAGIGVAIVAVVISGLGALFGFVGHCLLGGSSCI